MIILYILGYIKYIVNVNFICPFLLKKKNSKNVAISQFKTHVACAMFLSIAFYGLGLSSGLSLPGNRGWLKAGTRV